MGVSLRTLAKLTNPALARWWKSRGMWLLGAGVACGVALVSMILMSVIVPGWTVKANSGWLEHLLTLLDGAITLCFLLCAILAASASARACHDIGEEHAAPAVATTAQLYTLSLLRTWPAFTSCVAFRFLLALGGQISGGMIPIADYSFSGALVALTSSLDVTLAVWQVLLWLVALQAVSRRFLWLTPVWASITLGVPLLAMFAHDITLELFHYDGVDKYFGNLMHNSYMLACYVAGLVLFALAVWWWRNGHTRRAMVVIGVLAVAMALNEMAFCLPGIFPDRLVNELRFALESWAQLAVALSVLPLYSFGSELDGSVSTTVCSALIPGLYLELPYWASFLSPLLNLVWLTALYLLISRVLLREPRQPAQ